jgi:CBS domain-containing protein
MFRCLAQWVLNAESTAEKLIMTVWRAKDIMHPRLSLHASEKGINIAKKLLGDYPGLPVVNDKLEVAGIVTERDLLNALKEKRTVHEFSAESLMGCGHSEHGVCKEPLTISSDASIDDAVSIFYKERVPILPVIDDKKRLIGIYNNEYGKGKARGSGKFSFSLARCGEVFQ